MKRFAVVLIVFAAISATAIPSVAALVAPYKGTAFVGLLTAFFAAFIH